MPLTPIPGSRAGLVYTDAAATTWYTYNADRDYVVAEISVKGDAAAAAATINIEAEGQALFSGSAVPLCLIGDPRPDIASAAAQAWVIKFAKPLIWTRSFPIKIYLSAAGEIVIHGVSV